MIIGYARTSTREQEAGLAAQVRELKKLGCEKIYKEQVSSVAARPELERLLDAMRTGDKLVVTKLDRLARSVIDLGKIVERLQDVGADLQIVAMGIDTSTATGKLMLNVLGSVAQFEREMMLERQRDGIEKAKAEGKYKGRRGRYRSPVVFRRKRTSGMICVKLDISQLRYSLFLSSYRGFSTKRSFARWLTSKSYSALLHEKRFCRGAPNSQMRCDRHWGQSQNRCCATKERRLPLIANCGAAASIARGDVAWDLS